MDTNLEPNSTGYEGAPDADQEMFFRVSAGLKRIIGRDLIVNDFVAIFELVKNAFDAHASHVDLLFRGRELYIVDDGKGMSLEDIQDKWLFVAYSAKRDGSEDVDYRDRIRTNRAFAGSKGVGRFSCDRLGARLRLQTQREGAPGVETIEVDWSRFEQDAQSEFTRIPVHHEQKDEFDLPTGLSLANHGTVLHILDLREPWTRSKLLDLKKALSKLINPFGDGPQNFTVTLHAPGELTQDRTNVGGISPFDESIPEESYHRLVNGSIKNFIFDTLRQKTTFITSEISEDGSHILSELVDRGETVYKIREANPFEHLVGSDLKCQLFYLNAAAKMTFSRRMGVPSVEFGSVFLFRNGFRVFPVGEENDDSFGLNQRKQQGFSRYLGTRDIIGRIDVVGSDADFQESTSRDQGLIRTPAYEQLESFFDTYVLRRLERYVVDVTWKDKADKNFEDISRMLGDTASSRITELVSRLANASGVELLGYSPRLVRILSERSEQFEDSVSALRVLARNTKDKALEARIDVAESRYRELKRSEEEARARADRERQARLEAEARALEAEEAAARAEEALAQEQARGLFLASVASVDHDTVVGLHHQILNYAHDMHINISNQLEKLHRGEDIPADYLTEMFTHLEFRTQQVLQVSRFATRANFRLDSDEIDEDLSEFIVQYLERIATLYGDGIEIKVSSSCSGLKRRFKPIEMTIILENLITNADKADASVIAFELSEPKAGELQVIVSDDGTGIPASVQPADRIFEAGVTTTEGSGLGLHHVARILDQMGASIEYDPKYTKGARFRIRIFR